MRLLDGYLILASAGVGLLVGLTGAGGGALMTPMLTILFGVAPGSAISSDLVATLIMRPFGAAVHARRGTVEWRIVWWLTAGSVPAAVAGAYVLHLLGGDTVVVERALGAALLLGAAAMAGRRLLSSGFGGAAGGQLHKAVLSDAPVPAPEMRHGRCLARRPATLVVGATGGFMVGATSVGAGSLMVVLVTLVYPSLTSAQLVATDLAQAIPLSVAAAGGAVLFGHVQLSVTAAVALGGVPGVVAGSLLSSRAPEAILGPAETCAVLASGLKYGGLAPPWILAGTACAAALQTAVAALRRSRTPGRASLIVDARRPAGSHEVPCSKSASPVGGGG